MARYTFNVKARKHGAIGVFDWIKIDADSQEEALSKAHSLGLEVNGMDLHKVNARFQVIGKRWFDGCNTYHSIRITDLDDNGKELVYVPFEYGYGDQYKQTAYEALEQKGLLTIPHHDNGRPDYWAIRDLFDFSVSDVKRKKDL